MADSKSKSLLYDCYHGLPLYRQLKSSLNDLTIEWSARLRRNLAITYPKRSLIRVNEDLSILKNRKLLPEVLVHELAHLAAYLESGLDSPPHGDIWKKHVKQAGYQPRIALALEVTSSKESNKSAVVYIHTCPVCQCTRLAKRRMNRWKCVRCREDGLTGQLVIRKQVDIDD